MPPSVNTCFSHVDTSVKLRFLVNFQEENVQFVPAKPRVEESTVTQNQRGQAGKPGGLSGIITRFKRNNAQKGIITGEKMRYEPSYRVDKGVLCL